MSEHVCRCSWVTEPHTTFGQCMRSKNVRVVWAASASGLDATREKKWDAEIEAYKDARREGINPDGSTMGHVLAAKEISDKVGVQFDANDPLYTRMVEA